MLRYWCHHCRQFSFPVHFPSLLLMHGNAVHSTANYGGIFFLLIYKGKTTKTSRAFLANVGDEGRPQDIALNILIMTLIICASWKVRMALKFIGEYILIGVVLRSPSWNTITSSRAVVVRVDVARVDYQQPSGPPPRPL